MLRSFRAAVLTAGLIAGFGVGQTPAAQPAAPVYELVLMQKPETLEWHVKLVRAQYDLCAFDAQVNHLEVKPFPTPPAVMDTTRQTYLFRGRDTVFKEEYWGGFDTKKTTPEQGCEVDVSSTVTSWHVDLLVGNTHTMINTDPDDGHLLVQTEDVGVSRRLDASLPTESAASYSQSLTLNGIALRCQPETDPDEQACIYGRDDGMVPAFDDGRLIVIASRFKAAPALPLMILEPQSLRLIDHPDPELFSAANYTR